MLEWSFKTFKTLGLDELYDLLQLRVAVFVVEQNCPYHEIDGKDRHPETLHLLVKNSTNQEITGYLRILSPGASRAEAGFGRVAVEKQSRGTGLGREMIERALAKIQETWPGTDIRIAAQTYLQPFYAGFGFMPASQEYDEDGIPHIDMLRSADDD